MKFIDNILIVDFGERILRNKPIIIRNLFTVNILCITKTFDKKRLMRRRFSHFLCNTVSKFKILFGALLHCIKQRNIRLVQQTVSPYCRFAGISLGDSFPQSDKPILVFSIVPKLHTVSGRLISTLRTVHINYNAHTVFFCPLYIFVQPFKTALFILIGSSVIFKKAVINVKPDRIKSHFRKLFIRILGMVVIIYFVAPDTVAKSDPFNNKLFTVNSNNILSVRMNKS